MNNSQVFLAFALPFSMLPLLIFTDSHVEMGERFKKFLASKVSRLAIRSWVDFSKYEGLPNQIEGFLAIHPQRAV